MNVHAMAANQAIRQLNACVEERDALLAQVRELEEQRDGAREALLQVAKIANDIAALVPANEETAE